MAATLSWGFIVSHGSTFHVASGVSIGIRILVVGVVVASCRDSSQSLPRSPGRDRDLSSPVSTSPLLGRDSSGIRIVDLPSELPGDLEVWRLDTVPATDIGASDEEEYDLARANRIGRFSNGEIVVTFDPPLSEVRVYDSLGRFLRRFGRQGEGPGEFKVIFQIAIDKGDTLWVIDPLLGRTTRFSQGGQLLGTTPLEGVPQRFWAGTPGALSGGRWVFFYPVPRLDLNSRTDSVEVAVAARGGESYHTVANLPNSRWTGPAIDLFSPRAKAKPMDSVVLVGRQDRFEVRAINANGQLRFIYRRELPRKATPDSAIRAIRNAARTNGEAEPAMSSHLPLMRDFTTDRAGRLWIAEYVLDDAVPNTWLVVEPTGKLIARVATTKRLAFADIGVDDLLIVETVGEFQFRQLRRYRIRRSIK